MPKNQLGDELSERLIETIIISTRFKEFRKEFLAKPKGHPVTSLPEPGHEYEALQASEASLKNMHPATASPSSVNAIKK